MIYCQHKLRFPALSLLFSSVFALALTSVEANRICWSNRCTDGQDWCLQMCNITGHELSCLAQYRTLNGEKVPAYFGCHDRVCKGVCEPVKLSDYICCCLGDLCNEIEGVTPTEEVPTPSPIPNTSPTSDLYDRECGRYVC